MADAEHPEFYALRSGKRDPKADLPAEINRADPTTHHFLQAAQLDGQVRFLEKVDGDWQVFDIGPWNPTEQGGVFYIARGRAGVSEVDLDCLWLIEFPRCTRPA